MNHLIAQNLRTLLDGWGNHRTGVFHLSPATGSDAVEHIVPLIDGGLMDSAAWGVLIEALGSHSFHFEPRVLVGRGNRRLVGALLVTAARRHGVDPSLVITDEPATRSYSRSPDAPTLNMLPGMALPSLLFIEEEMGSDAPAGMQELLREGRDLLALGAWTEADKVLSSARDLRMDDAPTLACLAWARHNNSRRPKVEREQDARALIQLASMLAPEDIEVQRYQEAIRERYASRGANVHIVQHAR